MSRYVQTPISVKYGVRWIIKCFTRTVLFSDNSGDRRLYRRPVHSGCRGRGGPGLQQVNTHLKGVEGWEGGMVGWNIRWVATKVCDK